MLNNIESIYSDYSSTFFEKPDSVIEFFEKHSITLYNVSQFKNQWELQLYIEILGKYAEALYQKSRYNVVIEEIDRIQKFIDSEIERLKAEEHRGDWYNSLQYVKGMSCYNLKDYKTSTSIFEKLVQIESQNDSYKRWLTYSKYGLNLWKIRVGTIICLILLVTETVFKSQIPNYYLRQTILVVALVGLLTLFGYEYYINRNFRGSSKLGN